MSDKSGTVWPDDKSGKFERTVTTTYTVEEVTRYVVCRSVKTNSPKSMSFGFGSGPPICACETREEAERIARLLADGSP